MKPSVRMVGSVVGSCMTHSSERLICNMFASLLAVFHCIFGVIGKNSLHVTTATHKARLPVTDHTWSFFLRKIYVFHRSNYRRRSWVVVLSDGNCSADVLEHSLAKHSEQHARRVLGQHDFSCAE